MQPLQLCTTLLESKDGPHQAQPFSAQEYGRDWLSLIWFVLEAANRLPLPGNKQDPFYSAAPGLLSSCAGSSPVGSSSCKRKS